MGKCSGGGPSVAQDQARAEQRPLLEPALCEAPPRSVRLSLLEYARAKTGTSPPIPYPVNQTLLQSSRVVFEITPGYLVKAFELGKKHCYRNHFRPIHEISLGYVLLELQSEVSVVLYMSGAYR